MAAQLHKPETWKLGISC